jgi:hypothetical protein
MPWRRDDTQRSIYCVAEEIGEEICDQPAPSDSVIRARTVFGDRQDAAFRVEAGPQLRQLFVAHQDDEMGFSTTTTGALGQSLSNRAQLRNADGAASIRRARVSVFP